MGMVKMIVFKNAMKIIGSIKFTRAKRGLRSKYMVNPIENVSGALSVLEL
jgi:hypothetical protein